jgi:hypothetical protein
MGAGRLPRRRCKLRDAAQPDPGAGLAVQAGGVVRHDAQHRAAALAEGGGHLKWAQLVKVAQGPTTAGSGEM